MSMGGSEPDTSGLDKFAGGNQKWAKKAAREVERLGKKIERKGDAFFDNNIAPLVPKFKDLTDSVLESLNAYDAQYGEIGETLGALGEDIAERAEATLALDGEIDGVRETLASINEDFNEIGRDVTRQHQDMLLKSAEDKQKYDTFSIDSINDYYDSVRQIADNKLNVEAAASGALGDAANQEANALEAARRRASSQGQALNSSALLANSQMGALNKSALAQRARDSARDRNLNIDTTSANAYAGLANFVETLDKTPENMELLSRINAQRQSLGQAQAGLAGQDAGLITAKAGLQNQAANIYNTSAGVYGMQGNVLGAQAALAGQKQGVMTGAINTMGAVQGMGMAPSIAAQSGNLSVFQSANQSAGTALGQSAQIHAQAEDSGGGFGELFGTVIGSVWGPAGGVIGKSAGTAISSALF